MIDFDAFHKGLPPEIVGLVETFSRAGFRAGLVGGVPRDFIDEAKVGTDFDIELRPVEEEGFMERFRELPSLLQKSGLSAKEKGYKVYEVVFESCSAEFTLPRVEVFTGQAGHSNFTAKHIADLDYSRGFKRRDFTANAIMFERRGGEWKLVDPLGGLADLRNRLLKACDAGQFVKDPVRFLRAIRFSLAKAMAFDPALKTLLENMDLVSTPHYLKSEALKSRRPIEFALVCSKTRPERFALDDLLEEETVIREYEKMFVPRELKKHIGQALFLSAAKRKRLLGLYGLSSKGLIELDLKEINLGKLQGMTDREAGLNAWSAPFMDFLARSKDFGDAKLSWLLKEEGVEFGLDFIERFRQAEPSFEKSAPANLKKGQILKSKLEQAMKG